MVNSDPRNIAVPDTFINNIPTDIRGLTFSRTPQQLINMYSLGNPSGIGPFFPNGLVGAINSPVGYANMATGLEDFPASPMDAFQVRHCAFSAWTQHMLTQGCCWLMHASQVSIICPSKLMAAPDINVWFHLHCMYGSCNLSWAPLCT